TLLHALDHIALRLVELLGGVVVIFTTAHLGVVVIAARLFAQFLGLLAQAGFGLGGLFLQTLGFLTGAGLEVLLQGLEVVLDVFTSLGRGHDARSAPCVSLTIK